MGCSWRSIRRGRRLITSTAGDRRPSQADESATFALHVDCYGRRRVGAGRLDRLEDRREHDATLHG